MVISLEHTIATGGFYLSSHMLYEMLMGQIHSFVLPSILTDGRSPLLTIFIRRIVHYMHNAYVVNDSSDRGYLLNFTTLDDTQDLFSLVATAILSNVLDDRTYELSSETSQENLAILQQCHNVFNLNAIHVIERHHLCYTRGLSINLLNWFFKNYSFSSLNLEDDDVDAFSTIFIPFIARIGWQVAKYKCVAEERGHTTSSTSKEVNHQVQSTLFGFEFIRDAWLEDKADEEEENHNRYMDNDDDQDPGTCDLDYDFSDYSISWREVPEAQKSRDNFLEDGKTKADGHFFLGLALEFKVEDMGKSHM